MLNINLAPEAVAWLKAILSTEEAEGACFRLREFKVGSC